MSVNHQLSYPNSVTRQMLLFFADHIELAGYLFEFAIEQFLNPKFSMQPISFIVASPVSPLCSCILRKPQLKLFKIISGSENLF